MKIRWWFLLCGLLGYSTLVVITVAHAQAAAAPGNSPTVIGEHGTVIELGLVLSFGALLFLAGRTWNRLDSHCSSTNLHHTDKEMAQYLTITAHGAICQTLQGAVNESVEAQKASAAALEELTRALIAVTPELQSKLPRLQ